MVKNTHDRIEPATADNWQTKMNDGLPSEVETNKNSTIDRQAIYATWWIEAEIKNDGLFSKLAIDWRYDMFYFRN